MWTSRLLITSCLAVIGAANSDLFQISVQRGDQDPSSLIAALGELILPHRSVRSGTGASIEREGVHCQTYSEPRGRDKLGDVFSAGNPAVFTDSDEPTTIGSFLCEDAPEDIVGPGMRSSKADNEGENSDNGGNDSEDSATVQFRTGFSSFTKGEVPLNDVITLKDSDLGESVIEALVVSLNGPEVQCQLFKGGDDNETLGHPFSTRSVTLGTAPVKAGAISCKENYE